ncbi:MAG: YhjD/YihY/BrkB family envelope integrity protein [Bacteroidales bacterium]
MSNKINLSRGKQASKPWHIPLRGWKEIILRIKKNLAAHHARVVSAGVAFYFFLSLFPLLAVLVSTYGLVTDIEQIEKQISLITNILPEDAQRLLFDFLTNLTLLSNETLSWSLLLAVLITLWAANRGTKALFESINVVYNESNKRNFIKDFGLSLIFTLGGIIVTIIALTMVAGIPAFINITGIQGTLSSALIWLRWPLIGFGIIMVLSLLYKIAPARKPASFSWVSTGAVISTILWIAGSSLFSMYINNFSNFTSIYGSFAAIIILMLWFFLTSFIILLGAEINAEMEHHTSVDTTTGAEKPLGQRGAFYADNVAADYLPENKKSPNQKQQKYWMELALNKAKENLDGKQGGPFGAVITQHGKIISSASNQVLRQIDPTAHAEIEAIREACSKLNTRDLSNCEIYTSCEPCPMCISALYWAGIKKIYYAADRYHAKAAGFSDKDIYEEIEKPQSDRKIPAIPLKKQAGKEIFEKWNRNNPWKEDDKNQFTKNEQE